MEITNNETYRESHELYEQNPEDSIGLEQTELCEGDIAHYSLSELYEDAEISLKSLLTSGKDFDTGWGNSKKELASLRIMAVGDSILVQVYEEMDCLPDLIYDCLSDDEALDLTEEMEEEICEQLESDFSFSTIANAERNLNRSAAYEEIMDVVRELEKDTEASLESAFALCKMITLSVLHGDETGDEMLN